MKINQVEQLVGITKKNIRYYESEGLLSPQRNLVNGYREYTPGDVELLKKIKLLRKLDLPIEEIRRLLSRELSLWEALDRHQLRLRKEMEDLQHTQILCRKMAEERAELFTLDAEEYLERMEQLEQEGTQFVNLQDKDMKKRKGSVSALVVDGIMAVIMLLILWNQTADPLPWGIFLVLMAIPVVVIIGVQVALKQRFNEIEGGEEDAASEY